MLPFTKTRAAVPAAVALLGALALAPSASALDQRLEVDQARFLGFSVAIDGDTLVLGALNGNGGRGEADVFQRSGDTWTQTGRLTASDGTAGDGLGTAVAIDGDKIVVTAPDDSVGANDDQGSAYTFTRTGARERTETGKLTATDGAAHDEFARSVAIDSGAIVFGDPGDTIGDKAGQGSVYVFTRAGAQTAKLTATDGAAGSQLGKSVAIDGDTIVAGAAFDDIGTTADQGSAYTFARTGAATRTETAKLTASAGGENSELGVSVAIDGDTIVAAAPGETVGTLHRGAVYTFARTGAKARNQTAELTTTDGAALDALGASVAIDGATITAGAPGHDVGKNADQGSVYRFARTGSPTRRETSELNETDGAAEDVFGFSVAAEGDTVVAGAPIRNTASVFFAAAPVPPVVV